MHTVFVYMTYLHLSLTVAFNSKSKTNCFCYQTKSDLLTLHNHTTSHCLFDFYCFGINSKQPRQLSCKVECYLLSSPSATSSEAAPLNRVLFAKVFFCRHSINYHILRLRFTYKHLKPTDSLNDAGWNVDILHWDDFSKLPQTIHILDFTAELGATENSKHKDFHQ